MRRIYFFALASGMAFLIMWLGGFMAFHQYIRNYPVDNARKTDAIVVLTGGRNRVAESMRLYNDGLADLLIVSGVGAHVTLKQLEAQNKVEITRNRKNVILGNEATNTIENGIEVSEYIRRNNVASVRLVTSYYHMPRSEQEILSRNPDVKIVYHPVYSQNVSDKWWKRWGSFYLMAMEYNKFIFVYIKSFFIRLTEGI